MRRRDPLLPQSEVFTFIKGDGPFYPGYGPRLFASRQPPFHNKWPRILPCFSGSGLVTPGAQPSTTLVPRFLCRGVTKSRGFRSPHVFPVRNRLTLCAPT